MRPRSARTRRLLAITVTFAVTPGQSSVRNGVTGSSGSLYRLHTGLSAQA